MDDAEVGIREVLWQTEFPTPSTAAFFPIVPGTSVVVGQRELWMEAGAVLAAGGRIVIGITDAWPDGAYQAGYALDANADSPTFLGPSPFAERDTGQFRMFLAWDRNPLQLASPVELLVAWNAEMAAPPAEYPRSGPVSKSWSRFWDTVTGAQDFPMPGSREWWAKAPPQCRSLMDAPPGVLDELPGGEVFVRVPQSWGGVRNGVVCLRISLGSMGCADLELGPYLLFDEVYAVPREPVEINIALEKDGAVSYLRRAVIGVIPFTTLVETGSVVAELDASFSPRTYDDVAAHPDPSNLATVRSISAPERDALTRGMS